MIGRIRSRDDFDRLRRHGRRIRVGPIWCAHLLDSSADQPRVAFAINRGVGTAVTRNRLRRRMRAVLDDLDLPAGLYLVGCDRAASELTFAELRATLADVPGRLVRS